ncbi:MAG: EamA family transporter, partial [Candidatus Sulfotelmatobacter sp.]
MPRPARWKILLAFAIIYLVWGSTFLAIRIGVRHVPPFLLAGMRFFAAGIALYAWMRAKGTASPTRREWASVTLLAVLIFLVDYGLVFWAEQRVPSGITAVMLATIPAFTALAEILILRTQRLTLRLGIALVVGLAGVAVLVSRSVSFGERSDRKIGRACSGGGRDQLVSGLGFLPQAEFARIESHEFRGSNAGRRNFAHTRRGHVRRVPRLSCTECVGRRMARAAIPDRRRFHRRIHGLCLAHPPRVSHE